MGSIAATQMRGDRERRRHCLYDDYDALEKGEERGKHMQSDTRMI